MCVRFSIFASLLLVLAPWPARAQPGPLLPTSGPSGGPVSQIALATDGDLFAFAGELHRSSDAGWSWHVIPGPSGTHRLAAGPVGDVWAWGSGGLFRTSDDGATWTPVPSAPADIRQLAFGGAEHLFAATSHGAYVSADTGSTWTQADGVPIDDVPAIVWMAGAASAAAGDAIYRSEDLGLTWTRVAELDGDVTALAAHPEEGYYAGVHPGLWKPPVGGIYRVHLDGSSTPTGLPGHYIEHILVRFDGLVFAGSGGWCDGYNWFEQGIYRSVGGSAPWDGVGCSGYVGSIVADTNGLVFAAMLDGFTDIGGLPACGVISTSGPGTQWTKRNRGLGKATVFDIAVSAAGALYAAADKTIACSEDGGVSWNEIDSALPAVWPEDGTWHLAAHPDGTLFAVNPWLALQRSTDRGRTWTTPCLAQGPTRVTVTAGGTVLLGTLNGELWRSTDRGETWSLLSTWADHIPIQGLVSGPLSRVAIVTPSQIVLYDSSGEWQVGPLTTGQPAFAPDEHALYVANGVELQRWVEETGGWVQQPMPAIHAEDVAVDTEGRVYAATRTWVGWMNPGDPAWHVLGSFHPGWYLGYRPRLAFDSGGYLYLGTDCDGVYRSSTPVRSPTAVEEFDPGVLAAWACAPNPCRGATHVTFGLARPGAVQVSIYDVRGRLVTVLANGRRFDVGSHALEWIPSAGMPSGVYTYRIQAGGVVRSGRIVLVR